MQTVTAQDVQAYMRMQNYLTLDELAGQAGTTPARIRQIEAARCIPATSYVVGGEMRFTSTFGTYHLPVRETRYYHPDIVRWAKRALELLETMDLTEAARTVRADFDAEFERLLDGAAPPWPRGVDYAWDYIVDGTWGLCLKDVDVASLLAKEQARVTIRSIVKPDADHVLTEAERQALQEALVQFETVALPFAPHEVGDSCRHSELGPAIRKYGLSDCRPETAAE